MKIGIINNLYQPYHKGGAEKVVAEQIKQLKSEGHQLFLITAKPHSESKTNEELKTYYLNSNYYYLDKKNIVYRLFWQIANFFNFAQGKKLKKILKKEGPDLIISHNLMGIGWKTFRIIRNLKIKQEHTLHDIQLIHPSGLMFWGEERKTKSLFAKIYQKLIKSSLGSPALIISPSKWLLEEHQKRDYFPKSKLEVKKNSLSFTDFKKISQEELKNYNSNKDKTNFLFLGQLEKHKGIMFLIESFKQISEKNISLKIIGTGSLENRIKEEVKEDQRLEFLGYKNKEDLGIELQKMDCLIVPSTCYENSPTVILEAQHFNKAIIAANLGGIPELIKNNNEYLFTPNNQPDLIKKIREFHDIDKNNKIL